MKNSIYIDIDTNDAIERAQAAKLHARNAINKKPLALVGSAMPVVAEIATTQANWPPAPASVKSSALPHALTQRQIDQPGRVREFSAVSVLMARAWEMIRGGK